ncbi:MAG: hypothetical protein M3Z75_07595, partial [Actinomycetota bacterium]|nr:hypothetical protein [Actinomycetota bacterium]
ASAPKETWANEARESSGTEPGEPGEPGANGPGDPPGTRAGRDSARLRRMSREAARRGGLTGEGSGRG